MAKDFGNKKNQNNKPGFVYRLFNPQGNGKGVKKEPEKPPTFMNFFPKLGRSFNTLMAINAFIVLGNFPLFFFILGWSGNLNYASTAPASSLFAPLFGTMHFSSNPVTMALFGVHGVQVSLSVQSLATKVMFVLGALDIFVFGFVNVGTTYQLRELVKGEPMFLWKDFWYAIKKNKKQAFVMGLLDCFFIFALAWDILFFYYNIGTFLFNLMFYLSLLFTVIYFVMRFYIYFMMITFDLKLTKIIKNALIFSVVGLKRNCVAVLGVVVLAMLHYAVIYIFLPLGILLPFMFGFAVGAFICAYAAWPRIKEIMIDPYYPDQKPEPTEPPIFRDTVE